MTTFRGSQWTIYLILYYFVYFLLIFCYVSIRAEVSTTDTCLSYTDSGFQNINQGTRINTTITTNTYDVVTGGFWAKLWSSFKFASGFDHNDSCIGGMGFITAFLFTYLPLILFICAIVMFIWI
jgi:hypothetical protein